MTMARPYPLDVVKHTNSRATANAVTNDPLCRRSLYHEKWPAPSCYRPVIAQLCGMHKPWDGRIQAA